jgi:hypothetical protein
MGHRPGGKSFGENAERVLAFAAVGGMPYFVPSEWFSGQARRRVLYRSQPTSTGKDLCANEMSPHMSHAPAPTRSDYWRPERFEHFLPRLVQGLFGVIDNLTLVRPVGVVCVSARLSSEPKVMTREEPLDGFGASRTIGRFPGRFAPRC